MTTAAYARRGGIAGARATTVPGALTAGATSITCTDLSTWAGSTSNGPISVTINRGLTDEETTDATGISTNTLTGVVALASDHAAGATIEMTSAFVMFDEANALVSAIAANTVRVYVSATVSIAHNSSSTLAFDSERWDGNTMHSTSANTGRLTCQKAGKYLIFGNVQWAGNATGIRQTTIRLNGTTSLAATTTATTGTQLVDQSVSTVMDLSASDYVELLVLQDSGGALDLNSDPDQSCEFGMQFLGF